MPRPKRQLHATVEETLTPPDTLSETQAIARITKAAGNNLYAAELPNSKAVLVELEPKFRSTIWIKRGSYVVVDTQSLAERENKIDGEIVNVVRDEKAWRKMGYWYVMFYLHYDIGNTWGICLVVDVQDADIIHCLGRRSSRRNRRMARIAKTSRQ